MGTDVPVVLGVDVGATKILVGTVDEDGAVLRARRSAMDRSGQAAAVASVRGAIDAFWRDLPPGMAPRAIGLGLVGQIDRDGGRWVRSLNIPIGEPVPLAAELRARFGVPVALDNDVHAATLGELRLGAGRGARDFLYLNVGTGIAVGIVAGGRLVRGAANYAGEVGHMIVEPDGDPCPCGRRGCLEPIASGGGMLDRARAAVGRRPDLALRAALATGTLTAGDIFAAAAAGDESARAIAERAARGLGVALTNLVNLLNPETVALGGGLFRSAWLARELEARVRRDALPGAVEALRGIAPSALATDRVGLIGAACLAWEALALETREGGDA